MSSIIIGTAGHIDHGKSALVRALTGTDPDRLPEEKKRGITIDLGFADLELDGIRFGFVDVPGHERFVKNMLAGAHGIDLLALVIAADEGVMPQTREHFDICKLLGINNGIVVITKTDLVDAEMLSLVEDDAAELASHSFLESAPVVAVSSRTGAGLAELKEELKKVARQVPARSTDLVTRLPIDRAFSMKGFGPVVTGTLISGEITEGAELELLPKKLTVRVRGTQVHGKVVTRAVAGQRTAVNLAGVDVAQLERGMVLAEPQTLRTTQIIDARIDVLPNAPRGVRSRSRVRLHLNAVEVLARVRVLDHSSEIGSGKSGLAQLRVESPVSTVHGDRFILRSYSPAETIAGGVVLDPFAVKHRGKEMGQTRSRMNRLIDANRVEKLVAFVEMSELGGRTVEDLIATTGLKREVINDLISQAIQHGGVVEAGGLLLSSSSLARLSQGVLSELENHHKREPLARGMLRETLREKVFTHSPSELFAAVIQKLEASGQLVAEKDIVRATSHKVDLSEKDSRLREKLEEVYSEAGVEAPSIDDALVRAGVTAPQRVQARKVLQLLIEDRVILLVQNDMFMHSCVLDELKAKLLDYASRHEPERLIDVAGFKDLAGVSRKYAIPLLEYFDREKVTRRAGDKRIILLRD
jgi:selenocysteine-specific elongation factor